MTRQWHRLAKILSFGADVHDGVREELIAALPRVQRFARRLAGSIHDGDDLLQDAVERALSRLDQFRPGTNIASWIFRIIYSVHLNRRRDEGNMRTRSIDALQELLPGVDGERVVFERMTVREVVEAYAKLPDIHREVLNLVGIEELSYQEAAEILNVPVGTVMSRLARARLALHAHMQNKTSPAQTLLRR